MWQQVVVFLLVVASALYVGRHILNSLLAFRSSKSGCAKGCQGCSFQPPTRQNHKATTTNIIPLTLVQPTQNKTPKP